VLEFRRKRSNLSTAFFKATQIKRYESDFQSFTIFQTKELLKCCI